jgi:hypothetical protein
VSRRGGGPLRLAVGVVGTLVGAVLDLLVRRVPTIEPVVFDRDRSARWAAMVDAASVARATDCDVCGRPSVGSDGRWLHTCRVVSVVAS